MKYRTNLNVDVNDIPLPNAVDKYSTYLPTADQKESLSEVAGLDNKTAFLSELVPNRFVDEICKLAANPCSLRPQQNVQRQVHFKRKFVLLR